jgi:hypothetical protein
LNRVTSEPQALWVTESGEDLISLRRSSALPAETVDSYPWLSIP